MCGSMGRNLAIAGLVLAAPYAAGAFAGIGSAAPLAASEMVMAGTGAQSVGMGLSSLPSLTTGVLRVPHLVNVAQPTLFGSMLSIGRELPLHEMTSGMKMLGSMAEYQHEQQLAAMKLRSQKIAMRNANMAYLTDLERIETERGRAARSKALSEFKLKQQKRRDRATALNSGFGNPTRVVQDIGALSDLDYNQVQEDYLGDMIMLSNQQGNAYAEMKRTYSKFTPVVQPSGLKLGMGIAGAVGSYLGNPASERLFFRGYGKDAITGKVVT